MWIAENFSGMSTVPVAAKHQGRFDKFRPTQLLISPFGATSRLQGDRFIPTRSAMDLDVAHFNLFREAKENANSNLEVSSPLKEEYKRQLAENLLHDVSAVDSPKILSFKKKDVLSPACRERPSFQVDSTGLSSPPPKRTYRHIPQSPDKILDAPELVDDYYLNLLDWSCNNVVAVALGTSVYLWFADSGAIKQLMNTTDEEDFVTSVAWAQDGKHIAIGLNNSEIQLLDVAELRKVRSMHGHQNRVGSLAWNGSTLTSGGRDSRIINHDVRIRDHRSSILLGHTQEVCGLKWAPSGNQLASGGNDNVLFIWDAARMHATQSGQSNAHCLHRMDQHKAAVKALAWCPFQANLLASGGGTADRCIKFWNTQTGACIRSVDTLSQVCALQWSTRQKEILSSHGFSLNQLCLWRYPSMVKLAELRGHSSRVLHLAQSPDGRTVVSAAADETLRFWNVFDSPHLHNKSHSTSGAQVDRLSLRSIYIR